MAKELAFALINPYTIAKSRTGGVIGRFMSRTGLDLVAARMFGRARSWRSSTRDRSGRTRMRTRRNDNCWRTMC